ncbi:hypothetical protein ANO14919_001930 [Xylariales sp. No.14919]|nr:hypothetical protein ANO14919_001930 [Xylariales sp. No.14919]
MGTRHGKQQAAYPQLDHKSSMVIQQGYRNFADTNGPITQTAEDKIGFLPPCLQRRLDHAI